MKRWPVSDTGVPTFEPIVCTDGVAEDKHEKTFYISHCMSEAAEFQPDGDASMFVDPVSRFQFSHKSLN